MSPEQGSRNETRYSEYSTIVETYHPTPQLFKKSKWVKSGDLAGRLIRPSGSNSTLRYFFGEIEKNKFLRTIQ